MRITPVYILFLLAFLGSCKYYKRDIMFKAPKEKEEEFKKNSYSMQVPKNYLLNKNDQLEFSIFTNKGEVLIDPTSEFAKQISGSVSNSNSGRVKYTIQADGYVFLPILGRIKLDSITIFQCDSLLSSLYSKYYLEPFVYTKVLNRRVYILGKGILGTSGGTSGGGMAGGTQIYELEHENITLIDILTRMGGPGIYSHVERIKVIRGDLKNPTIFTIDMTRWDSFQKSEMRILPNDIIYIESGRRAGLDFLRDFSMLSGLVSALLTLYLFNRVL